ncbi:MAG: hypothetical protein AAFY36_17335, partial [Bacteroidota bacterium]
STNAHQGLSTDFGLQAGFSAQTLASNCQTMELMGGLAQFVSFTVQPADPSVASVFASLGTNLDIVYTIVDGQTLFYTPNAGGSTLTQIEPGRGYEVWVREPTDFTICGTPNDQNFSLPLQLGLNFIGYYGSEVPITNHFSSIINPDPLDSPIQLQNVFTRQATVPASSFFYPDFSGNTLLTLESGKGYYVNILPSNDPFEYCGIANIAALNRLSYGQVDETVRLIDAFLAGDVDVDTITRDLVLPAELNPFQEGCRDCGEINTLLAGYNATCGSPNSADYQELRAAFLNSQLGWNRTAAEYNKFIADCGTYGGTCDICPPPPANQFELEAPSCSDILEANAIERADMAYLAYLEEVEAVYRRNYTANCMVQVEEEFVLRSKPREYHYTLYYYNQAGNLAMTVPPEGVDLSLNQQNDQESIANYRDAIAMSQAPGQDPILPDHSMLTHYRYNNFNEVIIRDLPDAVPEYTWYDRLGRPSLSQDGRQQEEDRFSYTIYDELGRTTEVGEFTPSNNDANTINQIISLAEQGQTGLVAYGYASARHHITRTFYTSRPDHVYAPGMSDQPGGNLRNRVVATTFDESNLGLSDLTYDYASHYQYDAVGNVDRMVQEFVELHDIGHRFKTIEYDFDFISGNVHSVYYQRGQEDQFTYHYEYDKTNRLSAVYTSELETDHANTTLWKRDATYSYYDHGPLRRMVIGQDRLQGCDYAYTIQGWIKGVNGSLGDNLSSSAIPDMNFDGRGNHPVQFDAVDHPDLYRYSNQYFNGDYKPIGLNLIPTNPHYNFLPPNYEYFNGNIFRHFKISVEDNFSTVGLTGEYDQLNRLRNGNNNFYNSRPLNMQPGDPEYLTRMREALTYDGNGNIESLRRWYSANDFDDNQYLENNRLGYHYRQGTNLLERVEPNNDGNAASWRPFQFIENILEYEYDGSGNLKRSTHTGVDGNVSDITWTPYGKVSTVFVDQNSTPDSRLIKFGYGPDQNRWQKNITRNSINGNFTETAEYQVRDAQGNVLATYARTVNSSNPFVTDLIREEQYLYGSNRLGQVSFGTPLTSNPPCSDYPDCDPSGHGSNVQADFGTRLYELTNHLGNVVTVFGESITNYEVDFGFSFDAPQVHSHRDHNAFGLEYNRMADSPYAGTGSYRFGFNGKENDEDGEWGDFTHYDYGFRIYNPVIARFLSVDPLASSFP